MALNLYTMERITAYVYRKRCSVCNGIFRAHHANQILCERCGYKGGMKMGKKRTYIQVSEPLSGGKRKYVFSRTVEGAPSTVVKKLKELFKA